MKITFSLAKLPVTTVFKVRFLVKGSYIITSIKEANNRHAIFL